MRALTALSVVRQTAKAVRDFYRGKRWQPGIVARMLTPLFSLLSIEDQLWIARDVILGNFGACLEAKRRWGDFGNVVIDGNEIMVGIGGGDEFIAHGCGRTWKAAFADADRQQSGEARA